MTREEAIWILDPATTEGALAEIRHCAAFNGDFAVKKAIADARILAVAAIREQEQRRWIPVTERLPDNNCPVLVRCTNTTISGGRVTHIGCCDTEKFWFLKTQPETVSFPSREWKVTHWMPLPEPPKEESEEEEWIE